MPFWGIVNLTINLCSVFSGRMTSTMADIMLEDLKTHSNIYHPCPFSVSASSTKKYFGIIIENSLYIMYLRVTLTLERWQLTIINCQPYYQMELMLYISASHQKLTKWTRIWDFYAYFIMLGQNLLISIETKWIHKRLAICTIKNRFFLVAEYLLMHYIYCHEQ